MHAMYETRDIFKTSTADKISLCAEDFRQKSHNGMYNPQVSDTLRNLHTVSGLVWSRDDGTCWTKIVRA